MQIDALERAGCEVIYTDDGVSGVKHRPALEKEAETIGSLATILNVDYTTLWRLNRSS